MKRLTLMADCRIAVEADAALLLDAAEQHLEGGCSADLLRQIIERARHSLARLARIEKAAGIDYGDTRPRTVAELTQEARLAQVIEQP